MQLLLSTVALRRTKDLEVNGRPLVALPSKTVHLVTVQLSREERDKYERWQQAGGPLEQMGPAGAPWREHCAGLGCPGPAAAPCACGARGCHRACPALLLPLLLRLRCAESVGG
jgi:hypothetical protein